jgi:hypothetical protein
MLQLQRVWTQIPRPPKAQSPRTFLNVDVNVDAIVQGTSCSTAGATAHPHDPNSNVGDIRASI